MLRAHMSALSVLLLLSSVGHGQIDHITLTAGTPEDKELTAIANEQDPQKRISLYQDFLVKYASNPMAVAFGNWQLSQAYQVAGDLEKAIAAGDKALAGSPHNLDIVTSQVLIAQQSKDNAQVFKYSVLGGEVYNSIDKQTKPAEVSEASFQSSIEADKQSNKNAYDFFREAAFGAISSESNAKTRMDYIERFTSAFPQAGLDDQLTSYALNSLAELRDTPRLIAYGNKVLTNDPENLPALLVLSNTYLDSGNNAKAMTYAQRAIAAAKAEDPSADKSRKISAGVAHTVMGRAYANEEKTQPSITELKSATTLLKGVDEQEFAVAAYFLGWDYAKLNRLAEARAILNQAVAIAGPVQGPAKDLLAKVNAARAPGK
jgi:tetratricopeptide (TPR) repeat protein